MIGAFCMATFGAKAQVVYTNDFSGGTTIVTHTNNGNFKVGTGDAGDQNASGSFSYNTTRTPENGVQEIDGSLSINYSIHGVVWLLLDTSSWTVGNYTVSFNSIGGATEGNSIYYDVFAGSGLDSFNGGDGSNHVTVRTASRSPQVSVRNKLGSATAFALDRADPSITDTQSDNQITVDGLQTLDFTLTADHVGTAGDYFLIGWTHGLGDEWQMDDLMITRNTANAPELSIIDINLNEDSSTVTLTWNSKPGKTYIIRYSESLNDDPKGADPRNWPDIDDNVPSGGETTSFTTDVVTGRGFYIVEEN